MRMLLLGAIALGGLLPPPAASAFDKPPVQQRVHERALLRIDDAHRTLQFTPPADSDTATRAHALAELLRSWTDVPAGSTWRLGFGRYDELNARMAALAACAPEWDSKRGRPRRQAAGTWLQQALPAPASFAELAASLQSVGWRVEMSAIESVLLCQPAQVRWDLAPRHCAQALPSAARLPCGALVTFRITAP